ncbi:putative membrane protein [Paenibacillus sacheonensis]|nr:putative membrane protein [Paenibacillus sacheonensis]
MKWLTGVFELILAIPILGGLIVVGSSYGVLGIMLLLHILTLVMSAMSKEAKYGSILGIITSVLGWIPFVGWFFHLVSAILLMVSAAQRGGRTGSSM